MIEDPSRFLLVLGMFRRLFPVAIFRFGEKGVWTIKKKLSTLELPNLKVRNPNWKS